MRPRRRPLVVQGAGCEQAKKAPEPRKQLGASVIRLLLMKEIGPIGPEREALEKSFRSGIISFRSEKSLFS